MKIKKRIITIVIAVILTAITCIPIFADANTNEYNFAQVPDDLGNQIAVDNPETLNFNTLTKIYIVIDTSEHNRTEITGRVYTGNNTWILAAIGYVDTTNNQVKIEWTNSINSNYAFIMSPNLTLTNTGNKLYIPVFTNNISPYEYGWLQSYYKIYNSTLNDLNTIYQQYYDMGYSNGYNTGYSDGLGEDIEDYTNITGYVTQLLSQFVGSEHAQYITPIAIVLVILFVYFLFIRFLLSLIKAKGVIKTCDIIMIVACIILLVVMYAPMLNLTIRTEQVTSESTETTQERRTEYEYDEYGRIISGPGGTIVYETVESTTSDHKETEVEVTTQPFEKEITTYEETEENIVRS